MADRGEERGVVKDGFVDDEESSLLPKEHGVSIQTSDDDDPIDELLKADADMTASDKVKEEMLRIQKLGELNTPKRVLVDFSNVFKSFIGSNFLGMPFAFSQSGAYAGLIGILVIAIVTNHCCKILINVKNSLPNRKKIKTYGDVGTTLLGKWGRILVDSFLVFTQTGFCIGYTIFMAQNLEDLLPDSVPSKYLISVIIIGVSAFPFTLVKKVETLGPTSFVADVALIFAMAMVYSFDDLAEAKNVEGVRWSGLPIFFGVVTSSYEGIGLVVPVEKTMTEQRWRYPMLLDLTIWLVTVLLGSFGMLGYITYGSDTDSVITKNLPDGDLTTAVKVCLIVAIMLTYPMQFYPVTEILDKVFFKNPPTSYFALSTLPIRIAGGLFVGLIAYFVPFFGLISGLIGALGSSMLAFILPVVFELMVFRHKLRWYWIAKDILIILFGGAALVVGTIFAVKDIIDAL